MKQENKIINIGAIGCGGRLTGVAGAVLSQNKRLHLQAVYDIDAESIKDAKKHLNPDLKVYESEAALLADSTIDWVMIGSWNCFHAQQAIAAMKAGKHVFCEKPLATSLADCIAVREAARSTGRQFAFGLVLRYSPHYQQVRKLLDENKIGKLVSFEFNETLRPGHGGYIFGNWRNKVKNAGSHLLEKCCHDLDLANWMVGSLPVRVACFGGRSFFTPENKHLVEELGRDEKGRSIFDTWGDRHRVDQFTGGADILDHQVAILEYGNGVQATFHTNVATALPERRFYMAGTLGTLKADAVPGEIVVQRMGFKTKPENCSVIGNDPHAGGDEVLAKHIADTMLTGAAPLAGVDEGIKSAAVAFAIDQAQETGQVVDLRPTWAKLGIPVAG
jgi:predicted dehydrogenase